MAVDALLGQTAEINRLLRAIRDQPGGDVGQGWAPSEELAEWERIKKEAADPRQRVGPQLIQR